MSGPVRPAETAYENDPCAEIEARRGRAATVGGVDIVRVLPTAGRRTVGPWCFVDLIRPIDAEQPDPMEVGPHPHIGLATVTWLFEGEAEHTDSLGTVQLIRPGELNLMSAGHGIAHAELGMGRSLRGAQMWVAQPEGTRHGAPAFGHHSDLPRFEIGPTEGTVILGSLGGVTSPAPTEWATVGCDLALRSGPVEIPVRAGHEHALVPIDVPVLVGATVVEPGWLGLIPSGAESVRLDAPSGAARALLIGGEPLGERIQMWWNFVARTREEITAAWRDWDAGNTDRFGPVPSQLDRIDAPAPPWPAKDR